MSDLFGGEPKRIAHTKVGANLRRAWHARDDEFYTFEEDIDAEVKMYGDAFRDKIVFCNCDREWSAFPKYFKKRQAELGIRDVLSHPGPFQSRESIELLEKCDIVVTNPPFAPFTEFMRTIIGRNKGFLVIGSVMKGGTKDLFPLIKRDEARVGYNRVKRFYKPDGSEAGVGCQWYTTLPVKREPLLLTKRYDPILHPTLDQGYAIEVSEAINIPIDYDGLMAVPVSYLLKHTHDQIELLGASVSWGGFPDHISVDGKEVALRLIVKHPWANPALAKPIIHESLF